MLIVGARQVGKTTLARTVVPPESVNYFDLEDPVDLARLSEPMLALGRLRGVVVIDEVQRHPDLFPVLRVLADREERLATFLVLGSASPDALRQSSESLAGRIEILELPGLGAADLDGDVDLAWLRGGYPRAALAESDADAAQWLRSYLRMLASRDLREFGLSLPAATIERFLALVAHHQANLWNAATVARALDISESTVRRYLDGLTDAMLIRQLQPWHANEGKRLVRRPKVFYRDTGLLHVLWGVSTHDALMEHFGIGASWESYVVDEIFRRSPQSRHYFWRTSNGAELDLVVQEPSGRRTGFEIKRADAPRLTPSVKAGLEDPQLRLDRVRIIYPGTKKYQLGDKTTVVPLSDLLGLASIAALGSLRSTFANLAPRLKTLVTRWKRGVYRVYQRPETTPMEDSRGTVVRRIGNLQTFLTASEVDRLVDEYLDGVSVNELAERYGVHRATVSAHLTRRGVTRRQPGLGAEEAAEAVKLHLGGVSMRAIARIMGVDRKALRRALVEASAISG